MSTTIYTAEARVAGGRDAGRGRLGGDGDGVNTEQFLAVGYAACFEAVMTAAARRVKLAPEQVADVAIEANVMLNACEDRTFELAVRLGVELPSVADLAQAAELVRVAHTIWAYQPCAEVGTTVQAAATPRATSNSPSGIGAGRSQPAVTAHDPSIKKRPTRCPLVRRQRADGRASFGASRRPGRPGRSVVGDDRETWWRRSLSPRCHRTAAAVRS